MANTLLTIDMVTLEALRILHGSLSFVKNVNRDYDANFARDGAKIGDTLRVRKPPLYTVRTGRVMSVYWDVNFCARRRKEHPFPKPSRRDQSSKIPSSSLVCTRRRAGTVLKLSQLTAALR